MQYHKAEQRKGMNKMKISTKVEFGIIALADIAMYQKDGKTVSSADISGRQGISQKYLEQILVSLRQAGLIRGHKGSKGGYVLTHPASAITFTDILNALDNSILSNTYISDEDNASDLRSCVHSCVLDELNKMLTRYTEDLTLESLLIHYREAQTNGNTMYYI